MLGVVLTGGRGNRMGGLDKGLQTFRGTSLALRAARRLQQQGLMPEQIALVANRNLDTYKSWGYPVFPDRSPDFAGPLAGMQAALHYAMTQGTEWVLTVPCDTPYFPMDLVQRMAALASEERPVPVYAQELDDSTADQSGLRAHPVFSLLHVSQVGSLDAYLHAGQRKLMQWMANAQGVAVNFDLPGDLPNAFANLNTLEALRLQDTRAD